MRTDTSPPEPLWDKIARTRARLYRRQSELTDVQARLLTLENRALQSGKEIMETNEKVRTLDGEVNRLRETFLADDYALYSLIQTGEIILKMDKNFQDITSITGDTGVPGFPREANSLVSRLQNRLAALWKYQALAQELLAEIDQLTDDESAWILFKQTNRDAISLLFENVYDSPVERYKNDKKGIPSTASEEQFYQELTLTRLKADFSLKNKAIETVKANLFVKEFMARVTVADGMSDSLEKSILAFRRTYLQDIGAMISEARTLRRPALLRAGLPRDDADEEAATFGFDAFMALEERLWNGTFNLGRGTFTDSVMAFINQFTRYKIKELIRSKRANGYPNAGEGPNVSAPDAGYRTVWIDEFVRSHQSLLRAWLADLDRSYAKEEVGIQSFMDYALVVSPPEKGTRVENEFYHLKQVHDSVPKSRNTYQGRVRDGGDRAVREFNGYFFRKTPGLAFIGEEQLSDPVLLQRVCQGKPLVLLFTDHYRVNRQNDTDVTDDYRLHCLLETIQSTQEHILFDAFNG